MHGVDLIAHFDDFLALLINLFDGFHSDLYNLVSSKVGKQRAVSEHIIKPDLIGFKLTELYINNSAINLFSHIFEFALIDETFLVVVFEFLFFMVKQKNGSTGRMHSLDDLWVVCF